MWADLPPPITRQTGRRRYRGHRRSLPRTNPSWPAGRLGDRRRLLGAFVADTPAYGRGHPPGVLLTELEQVRVRFGREGLDQNLALLIPQGDGCERRRLASDLRASTHGRDARSHRCDSQGTAGKRWIFRRVAQISVLRSGLPGRPLGPCGVLNHPNPAVSARASTNTAIPEERSTRRRSYGLMMTLVSSGTRGNNSSESEMYIRMQP